METAIPSNKISLKRAVEELKPETIEKIQDDDEILANIVTFPEWIVLRKRLEGRIESLKGKAFDLETDDMASYGAKRLAIDSVIAELQSVIDDIESNAEVMAQRNGDKD